MPSGTLTVKRVIASCLQTLQKNDGRKERTRITSSPLPSQSSLLITLYHVIFRHYFAGENRQKFSGGGGVADPTDNIYTYRSFATRVSQLKI
jgi:hypothetical protein